MHIVYMLINETRFKQGLNPFLYIGSKVDCEIIDGVIYDKYGKAYWSSSKRVKRSIDRGDKWSLLDTVNVPRKKSTKLEGFYHSLFDVVNSGSFYNLATANGEFNSMRPGTGKAISKSLTGKKRPDMYEKSYWSQLHTKTAIQNNIKSRIESGNAKKAAMERCARQKKDPEWVKWRSELSSKTFKGKVLTEHELWLRHHDDRYKPNRKLENKDVWNIRYGCHKDLSLTELCEVYTNVSKATLCRVRNFKVFKDINEEWSNV